MNADLGDAAGIAIPHMDDERPAWRKPRLDEPVVVLTCARSGSTLLRFILDSHPELACPPETGVVDLCTKLGVVTMLLDGPSAQTRPSLAQLGAASIRSWVSANYGTYLLRVGKKRWCDKSLGSAESANRFLDLFPKTKFICLYRHCMDVIDSALEASPFGLRGYGFDPFAAAHPGNSVAAVADYWAWHTKMITEFEQAHQDVCLRIRYEDLVADPEGQADRLFAFLDEDPVPGISRSCLPYGKEPFGPGDHKVWATASIHPDSVGRGTRIPVQLISPPVIATIDGLLKHLGYPPIRLEGQELAGQGERDGTLAVGSSQIREAPSEHDDNAAVLDELEGLLAERLSSHLIDATPRPAPAEAAEASFLIAATVPSGSPGLPLARWWRVEPARASLTRGAPRAPEIKPGEWMITGEARTWRSVLDGDLNMGTALRHGHLRHAGATGRPRDIPSTLRSDPYAAILTRLLAPPRPEYPIIAENEPEPAS